MRQKLVLSAENHRSGERKKSEMKTILILCGRYIPGFKDGGPVRSIKNLTDRLGETYDFRILTLDRDHGDVCTYPNIKTNDWNLVGKAKVWYVAPGGFTEEVVGRKAAEADVVYVCGCFNDYAREALRLKKQGKIKARVIVAAMGLFSPGAFGIKKGKKLLYLALCKAQGLFENIEWSATDETEVAEIKLRIGKGAKCHIARDLPRSMEEFTEDDIVCGTNQAQGVESGAASVKDGCSQQKAGTAQAADCGLNRGAPLRIVFLSRISRKKNLLFAIEALAGIQTPVIFDVYGTCGSAEDEAYLAECKERAEKVMNASDSLASSRTQRETETTQKVELLCDGARKSVTGSQSIINFQGPVSSEQVPTIFSQHDIFLFPTLGENFGHVIFEALASGCIPIISDRTPWNDLASEGAGCVLSLEDKEGFAQAIDRYAKMSKEELFEHRLAARKYAEKYEKSVGDGGYGKMFEGERRLN